MADAVCTQTSKQYAVSSRQNILTLFAASPSPFLLASPAASSLPNFPQPPAIDYWGYLQSIMLMLGILLMLWVASRYLMVKLGRAPAPASWTSTLMASGRMKVEDRFYLDPRKAIYIVRVEGHRYLLGVTEQQVSLLSELDPAPPGAKDDDLPTAPELQPQLPFIAHLAALMRPRRPEDRQ